MLFYEVARVVLGGWREHLKPAALLLAIARESMTRDLFDELDSVFGSLSERRRSLWGLCVCTRLVATAQELLAERRELSGRLAEAVRKAWIRASAMADLHDVQAAERLLTMLAADPREQRELYGQDAVIAFAEWLKNPESDPSEVVRDMLIAVIYDALDLEVTRENDRKVDAHPIMEAELERQLRDARMLLQSDEEREMVADLWRLNSDVSILGGLRYEA